MSKRLLSDRYILDSLRRNRTTSPTGDLNIGQSDFGVGILDKRPFTFLDVREGIITNEGPSAAADYTNNRYWVKLANIAFAADNVLAEPTASPPATFSSQYVEPYPVTVTNRFEDQWASHSLPTNETKWVQIFKYIDSAGNTRWLMDEPVPLFAVLNAHATGGGKYFGVARPLHAKSTDIGATADALYADFDDLGTTSGALFVNRPEVGRAGSPHILNMVSQQVHPCWYLKTDSDGLQVYGIWAGPNVGEPFICDLESTGGAAGSSAGPPTWVYTVSLAWTSALGTSKSPLKGRPSVGRRDAAARGLALYENDGTLTLMEAFEGETPTACPE